MIQTDPAAVRQLAVLVPVDARVVAPNALNYEKYFTDFNEGFMWALDDREILIGVTFSEYSVTILLSSRSKD